MGRALRVGVAVCGGGLATFVALGIAGIRDDMLARVGREGEGYMCEPWCPCKCNRTGCGCHKGKPR